MSRAGRSIVAGIEGTLGVASVVGLCGPVQAIGEGVVEGGRGLFLGAAGEG